MEPLFAFPSGWQSLTQTELQGHASTWNDAHMTAMENVRLTRQCARTWHCASPLGPHKLLA